MASVEELDKKCLENYGFDLRETYKVTVKFYKENEGKSVQLQYNDRLDLIALTQQAHHGKLVEDNLPPLGALDVIGKDRRNAWALLGDMTQEEAMLKFVEKVSELMQHLKPYLEALKKERDAQLIKEQEDLKEATEAAEAAKVADIERQKQEEQRRQIQDALNRQSYNEFRSYAEQQYPDNPDQQAILIRQLQEQHYYQYMQQVYQQQMENQANALNNVENYNSVNPNTTVDSIDMTTLKISEEGLTDEVLENPDDNEGAETEENGQDDSNDGEDHECTDECGFCADDDVPPASMWTKKELQDFKDSIRKEGGDSIIKVGHGETVTVRVPTHKDGTALFWEFSTDHYDIAFGLFFEWTDSDENEVSVHISDSEDEDVDDEYHDEDGDLENGGSVNQALVQKGPPTSVIVPIYRRDCHMEVYAGTHSYPGKGVYLLKFDNTYSLWRSKTLYYRVYYTR